MPRWGGGGGVDSSSKGPGHGVGEMTRAESNNKRARRPKPRPNRGRWARAKPMVTGNDNNHRATRVICSPVVVIVAAAPSLSGGASPCVRTETRGPMGAQHGVRRRARRSRSARPAGRRRPGWRYGFAERDRLGTASVISVGRYQRDVSLCLRDGRSLTAPDTTTSRRRACDDRAARPVTPGHVTIIISPRTRSLPDRHLRRAVAERRMRLVLVAAPV